ncbi:MAG: Gfo/Idh/MocA family oxidoreductase [Anaerolineaceae bacterium]|nr:Gfo/Idh/MocA family oxidoreductase [Anaerolineaceae bacterium]
MENDIKLAVIGIGAMGSQHVKDIQSMSGVQLSAICDLRPERMEAVTSSSTTKSFTDYQDMLNSMELDGVLISTPHYDHTPIAIDCFHYGIHVLTEKPIAAQMSDGILMVQAFKEARKHHSDLKFAIMFQQRTYGYWKKIKSMLDDGELGKLIRATWIITNWFRNQSYYDNGDWRATWKGEGGGVLINQCPHNLDLFQWFFGMPEKVTGFAGFGKYHEIEVEDEVTAFFEYQNGMVGHFITSTAESPGTNRLEIIGERGKLVFENNILTFWKNKISMLEQIQTSIDPYAFTESVELDIPYEHHGLPGHRFIIENFVNVIRGKEELIVRGEEGLNQLQLSNSILLSSLINKTILLPMDSDLFKRELEEKIRNSKVRKEAGISLIPDISKSFGN